MAHLIAAGQMTEQERQYKLKIAGNLGKKKEDHRELPMDHPAIEKKTIQPHPLYQKLQE